MNWRGPEAQLEGLSHYNCNEDECTIHIKGRFYANPDSTDPTEKDGGSVAVDFWDSLIWLAVPRCTVPDSNWSPQFPLLPFS